MQFLNCLYGIATLWVVLLLLRRLPISPFARVLAFGTVCFLPRHIYMGALHSNDTLSYLLVATSIYLLMRVLDGARAWHWLALLSAMVVAAIFTKYTAFSLLPVIALSFALLPLRGERLLVAGRLMLVVLAAPIILLAAYMADNQQRYGAALPFNTALFDPALVQPRDPGGIDFASFIPGSFVERPILWPGQVSSFWTLLHASLWFDTEPKFLPLLAGADANWWSGYGRWLAGLAAVPPPYEAGQRVVRTAGSLLIALGLAPLALGLAGGALALRRVGGALARRDGRAATDLLIHVLLLALTLAGVVKLALGTPVYSAMKASYLLPALPAMASFVALGLTALERWRLVRLACAVVFALLFILSGVSTLAMVLTFA